MPVAGLWVLGAEAAGFTPGAAAGMPTRRFLDRERALAGSWWLGGPVTAELLALLAWRVGDRGDLAIYDFAGVLAVPLSIVDWCEHRLPQWLTGPQPAGVLVGFAALCLAHHDAEPRVGAVSGLLAARGLVMVQAVLPPGGGAAGDIGAAAAGALTGWIGWPQVAGALVVASLLALLLVAVPGAQRGAGRVQPTVPFRPCLYIGALVMILARG